MHKVGTKGQVVIDKAIRERLGVQPGWETLQQVVGDRVEITFLPPATSKSLQGRLEPFVRGPGAVGKTWDEIRRAAWEEAVEAESRGA